MNACRLGVGGTGLVSVSYQLNKELVSIIIIFFILFSAVTCENSAIPLPGLLGHCNFKSLKIKEKLVHEVFTIAVAHLVNISTKKGKDVS